MKQATKRTANALPRRVMAALLAVAMMMGMALQLSPAARADEERPTYCGEEESSAESTLICEKAEHTHGVDCEGQLSCDKAEHTHNEKCPEECEQEEHSHDAKTCYQDYSACTAEAHTHEKPGCYSPKGHTHVEACYVKPDDSKDPDGDGKGDGTSGDADQGNKDNGKKDEEGNDEGDGDNNDDDEGDEEDGIDQLDLGDEENPIDLRPYITDVSVLRYWDGQCIGESDAILMSEWLMFELSYTIPEELFPEEGLWASYAMPANTERTESGDNIEKCFLDAPSGTVSLGAYSNELADNIAAGQTITLAFSDTVSKTITVKSYEMRFRIYWHDSAWLRPKNIEAALYKKGSSEPVQTLNIDIDNEYRFEGGFWTEEDPSEYEIVLPEVENFELTSQFWYGTWDFYYRGTYSVIPVNVFWLHRDNPQQNHPKSVTVSLLRKVDDGEFEETGDTVVLSAENDWRGNFTDIVWSDEAHEYDYSVKGEDFSHLQYDQFIQFSSNRYYEAPYGVIKYTYEKTSRDCPVSIQWDSVGDNNLPQGPVKVTLSKADTTELATASLTAEEDWTGAFEGLYIDKSLPNRDYVITVEGVENYDYEVTGDIVAGYVVQCKYVPPTTTVTVKAEWEHRNNPVEKRPQKLEIIFYQDSPATGKWNDGEEYTLTAQDQWTYTIPQVSTKTESGNYYEYFYADVDDSQLSELGYQWEWIEEGNQRDGYTLTVKLVYSPKRNITVVTQGEMDWFNLTRNGEIIGSYLTSKAYWEENGTETIYDLDIYDSNGDPYVYDVIPFDRRAHIVSSGVQGVIKAEVQSTEDGFYISYRTNTFNSRKTVHEVYIVRNYINDIFWECYAPEAFTLRLYADGQKTDRTITIPAYVIPEYGIGNLFQFEDLPAQTDEGIKIQYHAELEPKPANFKTTSEDEEWRQTITLSYQSDYEHPGEGGDEGNEGGEGGVTEPQKMHSQVQIGWNHGANPLAMRPQSVKFTLRLYGGRDTAVEYECKAEDGWVTTLDLPAGLYEIDGTPIDNYSYIINDHTWGGGPFYDEETDTWIYRIDYAFQGLSDADSGNVTITKSTSGDVDPSEEFLFSIRAYTYGFWHPSLPNSLDLEDDEPFTKPGGGHENLRIVPLEGTYGPVTFVDGIASFKLRSGEKLIIPYLPADTMYEVKEIKANGCKVEVDGTPGNTASGSVVPGDNVTNNFHNHRDFQKGSVKKIWEDQNNPNRPTSVTIQLKKDGVAEGDPVVLNKDNNWSYEWTELSYKSKYTVEELNVPEGYKAEVTSEGNAFTVTNTFTPPEVKTTQITVTKVWKDGNSASRPDSVTVQLMKDGKPYGDPVKLTKDNWSYTWENLPEDGKYTVEERNVPSGYTASVKYKGDKVTITNSKQSVYHFTGKLMQTGQRNWPVPVLMSLAMVCIAGGWILQKKREE